MESLSSALYQQPQTGVHDITRRAFMLIMTLCVALNIGVAAFGAALTHDIQFANKWVYLGFVILFMCVSIAGAVWAQSNDDPTTSVVGGFICAAGMGAMCGPFISMFTTQSVLQAFVISAGIVLLTGFIGAVLPKDLKMWGAPLFAGLIGLILLYFAAPILGLLGFNYDVVITVLDYAGILLFCGIMVYDLNQAQRMDRTTNNAIDVAVNVFLNFANIFIRVLSLMGEKK